MASDLRDGARVYLAAGATDMRKSIDSLAAEVQEVLHLDPFSSCLFVFCNRRKDKLKILYWERNGFWLCYRRLERGTFRWPKAGDGRAVENASSVVDHGVSGWAQGAIGGRGRSRLLEYAAADSVGGVHNRPPGPGETRRAVMVRLHAGGQALGGGRLLGW